MTFGRLLGIFQSDDLSFDKPLVFVTNNDTTDELTIDDIVDHGDTIQIYLVEK